MSRSTSKKSWLWDDRPIPRRRFPLETRAVASQMPADRPERPARPPAFSSEKGLARREACSIASIAIGGILLFTAGFTLATARGLLDPGQFSSRVAASLEDERVARYLADRLTDVVVGQKPDLIAVRPVILSTITGLIRSDAFRGVLRTAARSSHRAVFEQGGRRVILSLPDIGILLRSALEQASPALAAKVPHDLEVRLASGETERRAIAAVRLLSLGEQIRTGALASFWLGAALVGAGIAVARDRRRGLVRAGVALLMVGLVFLAVTPAGRLGAALAFDDPALRGFAHGVWGAFYGNLRIGGLSIAGAGLLLAAMGGAVLEAADPVRRARELLGQLTRTPARPRARLARAAALSGAGVVTVIWPAQVVVVAAMIGGLALAYTGLRELSLLVGPVSVPVAAAGQGAHDRRWPAWIAAALAGTAVAVGLAWLFRGGITESAPAGLPQSCNGSAVLCGRTVNAVVFPGAHNAMSNAEIPGWMFPHHEHRIARQLEDGVRALLLDVHYGIPTGGRVKTDLDAELGSRDQIEKAVGPEGTAAAMRIRDRLVGGKDADRGIYFCHGFCELGADEVTPELRAIRQFLVQHPGEVLILILEDYVTPGDLERPFAESGLIDFVYSGATAGWPTLHQLIADNQRLIVFAESGRPGLTWLHPAFQSFQETPYTFHTTAEMSCRANRGGDKSALFLVNHWIETTPTPRPSNAAVVNAYDFLLARARRCQRERRRLPNVIAVDFYATGDLFRVVRTLNEIEDLDAPATAPSVQNASLKLK